MLTEPSIHDIGSHIYTLRKNRVMIDCDLASLYGLPTKRLNQQVQRNKKKFPNDFVFQLTKPEFEDLGSQASDFLEHGGRRHLPYAYTEYGAAMAAHILKSNKAAEISVSIVRAFGLKRNEEGTSSALLQRLSNLEDQNRQILRKLENFQSNPIPKELTSPSPTEPTGTLSNARDDLDVILKKVGKYFGICIRDIKGHSRKRAVVIPRQVSMYLLRQQKNLSFFDIGLYLGGRDHTTVLHAYEKIKLAILSDKRIAAAIEFLKF